MSNLYVQGLIISALGMSLTFLALGLLILAMILLERYFRDEEPAESTEEVTPEAEITAEVLDDEDAEIAAVIATAIAYWQTMSQRGLGATLEAGPSRWWAMGRAQQSPAAAFQKLPRRKQS